jgi:methionyl-tRNA synthetase
MKMAHDNLETPLKVVDFKFSPLYIESMSRFDIHLVSNLIWQNISRIDEDIQKKQPFKLVKTDKEKANEMIRDMVADLFVVSKLLEPFMPSTAETIQTLIKENKMPEAPLFARKD